MTALVSCPLPSNEPFPDIVTLSTQPCEETIENAVKLTKPDGIDVKAKGIKSIRISCYFVSPLYGMFKAIGFNEVSRLL